MKQIKILLLCIPFITHAVPFAYVTNDETPGFLTPIDLATNTALTPIEVGNDPIDVAITPNGKFAYVVNVNSNNVTPVNLVTNTAQTPINVGSAPESVAITPNGKFIYVTNSNDNTVSVINSTSNQVIATIVGFNGPNDIAITPDGSKAYVSNVINSTVAVINLATNQVITTISSGFDEPTGIAITPDGKTAYVANNAINTVTPITIATNAVGTPITVETNPLNIAITPDGTIAYVVNNGSSSVTPIFTATNMAGTTFSIGVGTLPLDIAITPDGTKGVVTIFNLARTQVFNIPSNALDGTTAVADPFGIAIAPFILPPTSATAVLTKNKFLNTTECVLVVTIVPAASSSPVAFNVYQNGVLVAQETSTSFNICLSSDCNAGGLFVTSVGANGVESTPVSLVIT